ncbi:MAG TPA: sugar transferase [Candidatus Obscuribacterales bacterium]
MRVIVFSDCSEGTLPQHVALALKGSGAGVVGLLGRVGQLSKWFSQNDIYYYLLAGSAGAGLGATYSRVLWLRRFLAERNIDAIVYMGGVEALVVRAAAWLADIPIRIRVAACVPCSDGALVGQIESSTAWMDSERFDAATASAEQLSSALAALLGSANRENSSISLDVWGLASGSSRLPIAPFRSALAVPIALILGVAFNYDRLKSQAYRFVKRMADLVLTVLLCATVLPVAMLVMRYLRRARVLRVPVVGQCNRQFQLYCFAEPTTVRGERPGDRWSEFLWWVPALVNIWRGELSFVGPRLRGADEAGKPGCNWYDRQPGITGWSQVNWYDGISELELNGLDAVYATSCTVVGDLRIFAKALLGSVFPFRRRSKH